MTIRCAVKLSIRFPSKISQYLMPMIFLEQSLKFLGRNTVTVLVFHKVPLVADPLVPDDPDLAAFIQVLDMAMEHFTIVPLDDVVTGLLSGKMPKNAACLTFDDGYADWSEGLIPVLLQRDAHATFFVTTGQLEGLPMWHERVIRAVRRVNSSNLDLTPMGFATFPVATVRDKCVAISRLQDWLKYQPVVTRDMWLDQLETRCGVEKSAVSTLSIADLRALHNKGFTVGSHTVNHPILTQSTDAEALGEIVHSREWLETAIGGKVDSFAYPNGRPAIDFTPDHSNLVKQAGYRYAVATNFGVLRHSTNPFSIPRFSPWGPGMLRMRAQLLRNQLFDDVKSASGAEPKS